jgi:hypothetical protein
MIVFMVRTLAPGGTESVIQLSPPCEKDVKGGEPVAGEAVAEAEVHVD